MQTLDKTRRNRLERSIKEARDVAEQAARATLEQLGVGETSPFSHLSEPDRELRRKLRAHGRQLGDSLNGDKAQTMDRLIEEVAYEHWHRMLFTRFLAENNLLMYPDPDGPVAVTLEECQDLAAEENAANGWELAARFAARMLPQIFRLDSPVFQLTLPPEHQQKLERLLTKLPTDVFTASDSLGWVYQFWQANNKDRINKSEVKIGVRELPAVTQLFTEPYMVSFLLDNSLGAWWAARRLSEADLKNAGSEEELRQKAAIPGVPLEYLRFVRKDDGAWTPAAGTFDGWPEQLADLKTLDPCCGSGHFLVAALLMLVPMRMERDKLSAQDAVDAVLRENLHGLELDQRCVELAAFALALTAWRYPDAGGYRALPELNVACSGLSISVAKEEWKQLGLGKKNLTIALGWMHETFEEAPVLGSLLNPAKSPLPSGVTWQEIQPLLQQALKQEQNEQQHEAAVVARGLAKAAILLAGRYQWVITNVPYLARGKQIEHLRDFCEEHYPEAKSDLATVFLDRCLEFCVEGGTSSIVLPQNWLFLTTYKKFREKLLTRETWHLIARLGPGAFDTISGEVVKAILLTMSRGNEIETGLLKSNAEPILIRGIDVSKMRGVDDKAERLIDDEIQSVEQIKQLDNPDVRVAFGNESDDILLNQYSYSYHGLTSGDMPRMKFRFWEIRERKNVWIPFQSTIPLPKHYGGNEALLRWESGKGTIDTLQGARKDGTAAWGKPGILVSQMTTLPVTLYAKYAFDNNSAVILPPDIKHLLPIWCFCSSASYNIAVREIDQSLKVTNATLAKVPFDLDYWTEISRKEYPHGLPEPYSDDPTQWIFHGHPFGSVVWDEKTKRTAHGPMRTDETVLQVAVARMLGYRWPSELDTDMELADEQREWVRRCEDLEKHVDDDGIVCIPAVRGEAAASDRLLNLLAAAYGKSWSNDILTSLLKNADHAGKTLETWLREKFFAQHCKLFQNRPFIWHIWDGLRDGFSVLVNYHQFDAKLLETLIYTYLGDWISRRKQDIAGGVDGAEERLAAAERLKKSLELILKGESPYDIFVRWKPMEKQPVGWNPDLNDGVRLNIRPFLTVADVGKKGAGVLRDRPNVNWGKDRGKDVESAPWHHVFQGERINDHHLTLAEKKNGEAARRSSS